MPAAGLAALPPIVFRPAAEAPVSHRRCLVAPADGEWCIAHRDERGWFEEASGTLIDEPLVYAALPIAPGSGSPEVLKRLARWVADAIDDGDYAIAARALDELADALRAARDALRSP